MRDKSSYERPFGDIEGLLNLADIKPGVRIQRWWCGQKNEVVTITSLPFMSHQEPLLSADDNDMWVRAVSYRTDAIGSDIHSLSDMGIVPYDNGQWNRGNYCTLAEPLTPKTFEAVTPLEFFGQLDEWLKTVDTWDSGFCYEQELPVIVPENLRAIIGTSWFEANAQSRWSSGNRPVTVQLIHA